MPYVSQNVESTIAAIILVNLLALAAGAAIAGFRKSRLRAGQSWPTAEGTIESAKVEYQGGGNHQNVYATVAYSYAVEGEYYSGFYSRPAGHDGVAHQMLEPFHPGDKLLIHYHPGNAEKSVPDLDSLERLRAMPR